MRWHFESVTRSYGFTEGPVWDGHGVLFSDIPNDRILRYVPETDTCSVYREDTNAANGLKLSPSGDLYACEMGGRAVVRYDPDGGAVTIADTYEGQRLNSPNDLAFDTQERLWFTDPFYGDPWLGNHDLELDHRSVYRIDPSDPGSLRRMTYDTTNPNGLLVSPDDERLYVAQSDYDGAKELRAYPIEGDTLGSPNVLHDFGPHRGVDGMCLDTDRNIIATAGWDKSGPGALIYVFEPSGRIVETHPIEDPNPTNCTFAEDLQTLYVTGSEGRLYRACTDRTGFLGAP